MDEFEQFRQTFFDECFELLEKFETTSVQLRPGDNDKDDLDALFRAAHSIKAGAGAFKLDRLVTYTHELENFLDRVRSGELRLGYGDPELIVQAGDILYQLVDAARNGETAAQGVEDAVLIEIRQRSGRPADTSDERAGVTGAEPDLPSVKSYKIRFKPLRAMYETANEPQLLLQALADLGDIAIQVDQSRLPPLAKFDPLEGYLEWQIELTGEIETDQIEDVFEFVDGDCELEITCLTTEALEPEPATADISAPVVAAPTPDTPVANGPAKKTGTGSIRVDLDRVDQLVDMVGELVIAQAMALESLSEQIDTQHVRQLQALEDLTLRTRQLQEGVMAIRMQPVRTLFSRFPRVVRDLSKKLGKTVRLELAGETTEVDKTIIEELADPLTHMIRNCLDHGIETPDARRAAGKPEAAVVKLSAEHRNGRILIKVSDDGGGIHLKKVRARAIENGVISETDDLSDEEIQNLIFQPGFSTASEVSDVSGRGVGMDVVRQNIQKLGGRVMLDSQFGQGSTFTLALPLTLAVLDGMLISVAGERYVLPLSSILESVCPEPKQIRDLPNGSSVLSLRGDVIRLIDIADIMGLSRQGQVEPIRKITVIVETELGRHVGLVVDELLGQQQVVIKNLETNFRRIAGVAGTAILGDGRVRLILDIDGLANLPLPSGRSKINRTNGKTAPPGVEAEPVSVNTKQAKGA